MSTNLGGKYQPKKKDPLKPFLPIIGLIIMAIAGAVGWFGAPFVLEFGEDYIPQAVITGIGDEFVLQLLVAGLIFFVIVAVFSMVYAIFAPKPTKLVKEGTLKREREEKLAEQRRRKQRRRKMNARMREGNKELDDLDL